MTDMRSDIDWDKEIVWSTGERVFIIDGPSFDGAVEVRSPADVWCETGQHSCTVWYESGMVVHPLSDRLPRIMNRRVISPL